MSNRACIFLFATLAIVGTAHGFVRPRSLYDRQRCLKATRIEEKTVVVDVVGEIVPMTPEKSVPSSGSTANRLALIQSLQGGLARVLDVVPKPILYAVTAVVSGLLFFEMSRFVTVFSVPVLLVLGATQSVKEKLDEMKSGGPKTLEVSALSDDDVDNNNTVVGTQAVVRQTIEINDDMDDRRTTSVGKKLNDISRRIADARTAMTDARSAASNLKDRISNHQERLKDLHSDK